MDGWERKLATRDTNRVVRPFEWGTEWLHTFGFPDCPAEANGNARDSRLAVCGRGAERFRSVLLLRAVRDYEPRESSPDLYQSGSIALSREQYRARPVVPGAPGRRGRAMVVLPQWNSGPDGHVGLAKLLNRFGISALRMTMAYHAERMPAGVAARRLPRFEQCRTHHSRLPAVDSRCPVVPGLAGSSRVTGDSGFSAPAWDRAWPSSPRPTTARVQVGRLQSRLDVLLRCGVDGAFHATCARASTGGQPGRLAALLGGDQPGQLPAATAGSRHAESADLGAARQQFSAGLFQAGAGCTSAS